MPGQSKFCAGGQSDKGTCDVRMPFLFFFFIFIVIITDALIFTTFFLVI